MGDLQDRARLKIQALRDARQREPNAARPHVYADELLSTQDVARLQKQGLAILHHVQAEMAGIPYAEFLRRVAAFK